MVTEFMRYETQNAGSYLVWRLQHTDRVASLQDEGDLIVVGLKTGERVMIYLEERPFSLRDLQHHLAENTAAGSYSLFIFAAPLLLPDHQSTYLPDDWMSALLSAQGNKIYAFEDAGQTAYFFPVHFRGKGAQKQIRYGDIVNYAALRCDRVRTLHPYLAGEWLIASFDAPSRGHRTPPPPEYGDLTPLAYYYELLGVPDNTALPDVKRAYRALARLYHPDVNRSREALLRMKQINDAYQRIVANGHKDDK